MQGNEFLSTIFPFLAIFVLMYFLIIRPQSKKAKDHQKMLQELKVGDRIVTNGGLIGKVAKLHETEIELEVASGTVVSVSRSMIAVVQDQKKSTATHKGQKPSQGQKKTSSQGTVRRAKPKSSSTTTKPTKK